MKKDPRHRKYNEKEEDFMNECELEELENEEYFKKLKKGKKEGIIRR